MSDNLALTSFHDGIALVRRRVVRDWFEVFAGGYYEDNMSYLIDKSGNVILTLPECFNKELGQGGGYDFWGIGFSGDVGRASEGLIPFGCAVQLGNSIFNEVDLSGVTWETPFLYGYMDYSGNIVIPQLYTGYGSFSEGLAGVINAEGLCGYIDKSNNTVIPFEYDSAGSFVDGLAAVSKDGKTGYINAQNEVVIPFAYDDGFRAGGGVCPVSQNGYYGLIDYNGNEVLPFEYDDISECINGVVYAVKDGLVYIISVN